MLAGILVVPVMIVSVLMAYFLGYMYEAGEISKTSVYAQDNVGVERVIKAMMWAPFFENSLVAITLWMMSGWGIKSWWVKPLVLGFCFALLHVVLANDFRPFSVFPAFFVITFLIEKKNYKKFKLCGFIASVVFHSLSNSLILIPFFTDHSY